MESLRQSTLLKIYHKLFDFFGPQHWWPGETRCEIIVGAILTQNTNWGNVQKALNNLKEAHVLDFRSLKEIPTKRLAALIRSAGYFNVKAERLKNFVDFLFKEYGGHLPRMAREELDVLRVKLLSVKGVGPETADSILLYAFQKPSFVVDAYTKRIFYRHNWLEGQDYHETKHLFEQGLAPDQKLFNEYHALIVRLGKEFCKPTPVCAECPLRGFHYDLKNKCSVCHRALNYITKGKGRAGHLLRCNQCA